MVKRRIRGAQILREYIYVLKLIERLHDEKNWTELEEDIVSRHFVRLKKCCEEGKVFTAGRTDHTDRGGFGIVIFHAENEEEALVFMNEDPAVKGGIMKAELFPYRTAMVKK